MSAREAHDLASGEVWSWLNRHGAPWSPSDATVSDLAWRIVERVALTPDDLRARCVAFAVKIADQEGAAPFGGLELHAYLTGPLELLDAAAGVNRTAEAPTCIHCGAPVVDRDGWWSHAAANGSPGLARCQHPNVAYGHLAHPAGVPCRADGPNPCLGARLQHLEGEPC